MAYELAQIAEPVSANNPQQPSLREEKVVSSFDDYRTRLAAVQAKQNPDPNKNNAPNINDKAVEPTASGASLPLSPQIAAIARKEQKLRQEMAAFKAQQLADEVERKEYAELKALKAKIAAGDYSDVDKLVDYEKLVQHKLGKDPKAEELERVNARLAAMEDSQKKDVEQRYEAAVNQRRSAVKALVAGEGFPSIKEMKAEEAVVQHILDTWENDSVELSPEDAAKEVEAALLEKASKWASLVKPKVTEEVVADKRELPPLKDKINTLTNNMAATGEIKKPSKPLHLMTDNERWAEARRRVEEKIARGERV